MNIENQNVQGQNPEQHIEQRIYKKSSTEISGVSKAGLIIQIVVASLAILGTLIAVLAMGITSSLIFANAIQTGRPVLELEGIKIGYNIVAIILSLIVMPGSIATLVLSSIALKKQTKGIVIASGIVGIIFTGFLGGILTLVGTEEKRN